MGKWKGLNEGCKCLGNRVTKGRCRRRNSLVIYIGCEDMPAIPSKYYEKFDNKKFCVKRSTETYRYLLLNKQVINNNETCPEGYKCCGIIDTLNRKKKKIRMIIKKVMMMIIMKMKDKAVTMKKIVKIIVKIVIKILRKTKKKMIQNRKIKKKIMKKKRKKEKKRKKLKISL